MNQFTTTRWTELFHVRTYISLENDEVEKNAKIKYDD